MNYFNVIIQSQITATVVFTNPVPVIIPSQSRKPVGHAVVRMENGNLIADISTNVDVRGFFPAPCWVLSDPLPDRNIVGDRPKVFYEPKAELVNIELLHMPFSYANEGPIK